MPGNEPPVMVRSASVPAARQMCPPALTLDLSISSGLFLISAAKFPLRHFPEIGTHLCRIRVILFLGEDLRE